MVTIKLDELIQTLDLEEKQALEVAANHCVARAGRTHECLVFERYG